MTDIHRFCHLLSLTRCWQVALSSYTLKKWWPCMWIPLYDKNLWKQNFKQASDLSAQCCRATAVRMCLKSGWREPGSREPLSPFSAGCCEGNQRAFAEVVRSPTIPSNKPLWDLHEHCCKYTQAVCKVRALATFKGGALNKASVNIHGYRIMT